MASKANRGNLALKRNDGRIIIHFDYDCFYAAVFEREDPKLRFLPLAVQQKQIIVTCNYEARRRGLHKLQLVREARKMCPEVIIVLGEDLTRFRNASKDNYNLLRSYAWSKKVERLGFDEVFMDVTDMIDYNIDLLNPNQLAVSFFHLDRNDPTMGFQFDASGYYGHTYPKTSPYLKVPLTSTSASPHAYEPNDLSMRLVLGSHLSQYMRHQLEEQTGYTCTVGVSTNKLISKLVGNLNKPKGQTTLLPPYTSDNGESTVTQFIDSHDLGKIPGIGFKMAQKMRSFLLGSPATFDAGLVYGSTKEKISVADVRRHPDVGPQSLETLLGGAGAPKGVGTTVWGLLHGIDDSEVAKARDVPQQISIEDSYIRLDVIEEVRKELAMLAGSLIKRMRLDLTSSVEDENGLFNGEEGLARNNCSETSRKWIAYPQTLRLTTRPRPPLNPDGTRSRTFNRISKSCNMPSMIFNLTNSVDTVAGKLVHDILVPLFRKLHPERSGWNLSLVNLCATNMSLVGANTKGGVGRDIEKMFRKQDDILRHWKAEDVDVVRSKEQILEDVSSVAEYDATVGVLRNDHCYGSEDLRNLTQESCDDDAWDSEEGVLNMGNACKICGAVMPPFAMIAHERFHTISD